MSFLSTARAAIIAKGAGVAGIRAALPRLPETIPASPAIVLGQMTWSKIPGDRERTTLLFDLELYVERLATDDRTIATADDLIELVEQAYTQGITLGLSPGGTTQCVIRSGSANTWPTIGSTEYLLVRWQLELSATRQRGYTA